jgi:hypothetical protein
MAVLGIEDNRKNSSKKEARKTESAHIPSQLYPTPANLWKKRKPLKIKNESLKSRAYKIESIY